MHNRPTTWLIDIDGCILHQEGFATDQWFRPAERAQLCPGVLETLNELETRGDRIILMTARPGPVIGQLEHTLRYLKVPYHQLVYAATSGLRVLVNDMREEPRALAINLEKNAGLVDLLNAPDNMWASPCGCTFEKRGGVVVGADVCEEHRDANKVGERRIIERLAQCALS